MVPLNLKPALAVNKRNGQDKRERVTSLSIIQDKATPLDPAKRIYVINNAALSHDAASVGCNESDGCRLSVSYGFSNISGRPLSCMNSVKDVLFLHILSWL